VLRGRRHFPDQIAVYTKAVDIHVYYLSADEAKDYGLIDQVIAKRP
jgi:ATP-dependent protease ClpP protease subunit